MGARYNQWSFYLMLICFVFSVYALYSKINHTWMISPPNFILLVISVIAFVFAIKGRKFIHSNLLKIRSWLTIISSFLLSLALSLAVFLTILINLFGVDQHIETVHSPDGKYTIDFYQYNTGAGGPFGVKGELNGPLWFKKHLYVQNNIDYVNVEWIDHNTVSINNRILNLKEGDQYGY